MAIPLVTTKFFWQTSGVLRTKRALPYEFDLDLGYLQRFRRDWECEKLVVYVSNETRYYKTIVSEE